MLPLYEAKMIHHYDTRWATYDLDGKTRDVTPEEKRAGFAPLPRYWVHASEVDRKLDGKWDKSWMLGWRRTARNTDERTLIASMLPRLGYGDSIFIMVPENAPQLRHVLQTLLTAYVLDFVFRQKIGGANASFYYIEQLPAPFPSTLAPWTAWMAERVDRLNSQRLREDDNAVLRAELDAAAFHIYGIPREDVAYIMETFPIVKRQDEAEHGEYRTKRLILQKYDELAHAPQLQ